MQIIVIILNVILAGGCLWLARRIWLFRQSLKRSTQALLFTEMVVHETLRDAPDLITQGKFNIRQWNQFLSQLGPAIYQGKMILTWAQWGQRFGTILLRQTGVAYRSKLRARKH